MRLLACLLSLATPLAAADPSITRLAPSALDWATTPEGVAFAPIEGDRFAGAYMAMVRLPAGLKSPAHVKSANMYGLVVEGTMTHAPDTGGETRPLPPGAFYKIPAGLAHVSSCISQVPCVTFLYQDGAFDFLPVTR
ncbi:cupin domain-containing protein [Litoreibacter ponti]|nr:DUF4437 domain-containing protein [Litoreibacter ponti]